MTTNHTPPATDADDDRDETAAQAAATLRSLIDPMSGRIDNWSER